MLSAMSESTFLTFRSSGVILLQGKLNSTSSPLRIIFIHLVSHIKENVKDLARRKQKSVASILS